jgi:hypothetical protein
MEKDYLILKRASASRPSGEWNDDDYDVLAEGVVVGRIFKANAAPVGEPWMWTLAFGHHEDRTRFYPENLTCYPAISGAQPDQRSWPEKSITAPFLSEPNTQSHYCARVSRRALTSFDTMSPSLQACRNTMSARSERPCGGRATEERDEIAAFRLIESHSMPASQAECSISNWQ